MRSKFWSFVESCDEALSARAVRDLLIATYREIGVKHFLIATHAPQSDLRSFGVQIHNWPGPAVDHLTEYEDRRTPNPLFKTAEASSGPFLWPLPPVRRDAFSRQDREWFDRLRDVLGASAGVSQALRSTIVGASISATLSDRLEPDRVRLLFRIGDYAYHHVLALQRPQLAAPEQLTAREHELLFRATVLGERPAEVAHQLDVKISTVRTLRQKANVRLDAESQEQAAWRMIETGQLFRSGRKSRPRAR